MSVDDLDYTDVDFERTALKVVVCQARFDPLLRISYDPPITFQEAIREVFPQLEQRIDAPEIALTLGEGRVEPEVLSRGEALQPSVWNFRTSDGQWTTGLAGGSFSLETSDYSTFEQFADRFRLVYRAFRASYPAIDHLNRVGLRFVNVFGHDEFRGAGWHTRFNHALMGLAADEKIGPSVESGIQQFTLSEQDWKIAVRAGTEKSGNYRLDLDHAIEGRIPPGGIPDRIVEFNKRLYNLFRWAISEEMYNDMGPRPRV